MGRKQGQRSAEEPVETSVEVSDEAFEVYQRIGSLREQVGEGEQGRVFLQRRKPDGTLSNLPSMPVATFSIDAVAAQYGGGKYFVRFYKGKDYLGHETFEVDETVKPTPPAPVAGVAGPAVGEASVLLARLEGKLEGLMEGLRSAGQGAAGQAPLTMKDMIETLAAAKGLLGGGERGSVKEIVETVRAVTELSADLNPGGGRSDEGFPWSKLLEKAEPFFELGLEEAAAKRAERTGAPPLLSPPSATAPAETSQPKTEGKPVALWQKLVGAEVPGIIRHAKENDDPELWAEVYAEQLEKRLPESVMAAVVERAKPEDSVSAAWGIAKTEWPALVPYESWVLPFLTELRVQLLPEDQPPATGGDHGQAQ